MHHGELSRSEHKNGINRNIKITAKSRRTKNKTARIQKL